MFILQGHYFACCYVSSSKNTVHFELSNSFEFLFIHTHTMPKTPATTICIFAELLFHVFYPSVVSAFLCEQAFSKSLFNIVKSTPFKRSVLTLVDINVLYAERNTFGRKTVSSQKFV